MSRREGRDSRGKRLHFRFDRETPSPKKSRRDRKPESENRYSSNRHLEVLDNSDRDQKQQQRKLQDALPLDNPQETKTKVHPEVIQEKIYSSNHHLDIVGTTDCDQNQRRRLQDASPLENPSDTKTKAYSDGINEGLDGKIDGLPVGNKHSSDPKEVPRSRTYFQHDERDSTGHGGRTSGRKAIDHGRWSHPKERSSDRSREKVEPQQPRADDSRVWRHDGFYQLEAEAPPAKKRPAFREKKIESEKETAVAATGTERSRLHTARTTGRGGQYSSGLNNKLERSLPRAEERSSKRGEDGSYQRREVQKGNYQPRERFDGGGTWGSDRFSGRYGERTAHRPGGFQVDKWKHDLYEEANRSPSPKNEEEQIAKVEALLAL
ncbi:uncharacterized protein M6B38_419025 [Iris pallida]|uniref:Btz domain-containing protein n=1 Tax=Iris pallida TaxID=29817 RepID=A0AAX6FJ48_IRIPA|nr:uncharacterized protein M6B38_419025 [Iris pallida]